MQSPGKIKNKLENKHLPTNDRLNIINDSSRCNKEDRMFSKTLQNEDLCAQGEDEKEKIERKRVNHVVGLAKSSHIKGTGKKATVEEFSKGKLPFVKLMPVKEASGRNAGLIARRIDTTPRSIMIQKDRLKFRNNPLSGIPFSKNVKNVNLKKLSIHNFTSKIPKSIVDGTKKEETKKQNFLNFDEKVNEREKKDLDDSGIIKKTSGDSLEKKEMAKKYFCYPLYISLKKESEEGKSSELNRKSFPEKKSSDNIFKKRSRAKVTFADINCRNDSQRSSIKRHNSYDKKVREIYFSAKHFRRPNDPIFKNPLTECEKCYNLPKNWYIKRSIKPGLVRKSKSSDNRRFAENENSSRRLKDTAQLKLDLYKGMKRCERTSRRRLCDSVEESFSFRGDNLKLKASNEILKKYGETMMEMSDLRVENKEVGDEVNGFQKKFSSDKKETHQSETGEKSEEPLRSRSRSPFNKVREIFRSLMSTEEPTIDDNRNLKSENLINTGIQTETNFSEYNFSRDTSRPLYSTGSHSKDLLKHSGNLDSLVMKLSGALRESDPFVFDRHPAASSDIFDDSLPYPSSSRLMRIGNLRTTKIKEEAPAANLAMLNKSHRMCQRNKSLGRNRRIIVLPATEGVPYKKALVREKSYHGEGMGKVEKMTNYAFDDDDDDDLIGQPQSRIGLKKGSKRVKKRRIINKYSSTYIPTELAELYSESESESESESSSSSELPPPKVEEKKRSLPSVKCPDETPFETLNKKILNIENELKEIQILMKAHAKNCRDDLYYNPFRDYLKSLKIKSQNFMNRNKLVRFPFFRVLKRPGSREYDSEPEAALHRNSERIVQIRQGLKDLDLNVAMELIMENYDPVTGKKLRPEVNRSFEQEGNIQCKLIAPGKKPITFIDTDFHYNPKTGMLFKQGEGSKNITAVKEVPLPLNRTRTYLLPHETDQPETTSTSKPKEGNKFEELYKSKETETLSKETLLENGEKSVVEESVSIYDIAEEEISVKPAEPSALAVAEEPVIEQQQNGIPEEPSIKIDENEIENQKEEEELVSEPTKEISRTEKLTSPTQIEVENRRTSEEKNEEKVFPPVKENVFRVSHAKFNKKPFRRKTKPDINENTQTESPGSLSQPRKNNILFDDKSIRNEERISTEKFVQEHYPDGVRKDVLGNLNREPLAKLFSFTWTLGFFLCKLVHYMQSVSAICSVLTLTAMSIERYYAIVHPIRAQYVCTISQARRIIIATWIAAFLLAVPILFAQVHLSVGFKVKAYWCVRDWDNKAVWRAHELYMLLLILVIPTGDFVVFPGVMGVAYTAICWEVWEVMQRRQVMTAAKSLSIRSNKRPVLSQTASNGSSFISNAQANPLSRRKSRKMFYRNFGDDDTPVKQVIKMLVAVVVIYVICWGPMLIDNVLMAYDVLPYIRTAGPLKYMGTAFHLMAYFNSCINPVVYGFMSKNFRESFQKTLCCHEGVQRMPARSYSISQTRNSSYRFAESSFGKTISIAMPD